MRTLIMSYLATVTGNDHAEYPSRHESMLLSYPGVCRLIGKSAYHLGEHDQADLAYRKALEVNSDAAPAWKGLAELHTATGNSEKAAEAYLHLVYPSEVVFACPLHPQS
jgi:tetratricopeptide (TPR) repeat protein